jgi:hypothetical protein
MADIDVAQLVGWLVVALAIILFARISVDLEGTKRRLGPRVMGLIERGVERCRPVEEPDPLAEALRAQIRYEKLLADVQRLRRLVATDMAMSATRQIGNRIAYASLLQELETSRPVSPPAYAFAAVTGGRDVSVPVDRWQDDLALPASTPRFRELGGQRAPTVEVLELGPRRRLAR